MPNAHNILGLKSFNNGVQGAVRECMTAVHYVKAICSSACRVYATLPGKALHLGALHDFDTSLYSANRMTAVEIKGGTDENRAGVVQIVQRLCATSFMTGCLPKDCDSGWIRMHSFTTDDDNITHCRAASVRTTIASSRPSRNERVQ